MIDFLKDPERIRELAQKHLTEEEIEQAILALRDARYVVQPMKLRVERSWRERV